MTKGPLTADLALAEMMFGPVFKEMVLELFLFCSAESHGLSKFVIGGIMWKISLILFFNLDQ